MLRRNQINPQDTVNLGPDLELTGGAKYYLSKQEEVRDDSIFFIEPKTFILEILPQQVESIDTKPDGLPGR
ncbi:MAG: hypothetical protein HC905_28070 [Bacteroidales bacterium]|nr:hypothetical protein [Bacteroidales bacterium]